MFEATYISSASGTSKETGKPWYRIELVANTITGKPKTMNTFCTERAYRQAGALEPMSDVRIVCGVLDNGYITVAEVEV